MRMSHLVEQTVHGFILRYWGLMKIGEVPLLCEAFQIPCFLMSENFARIFESRSDLFAFLNKNPPRVSSIPPRIESVTPKFLDPDLFLEVKLRDVDHHRTLHIIRNSHTFRVCCDIVGASFSQNLA